ncbi:uncharacterized protein IL334_002011 [Kwoniella shivajii]|uniref:Uncharacterized protein n=1 Tax=Kwoniella shivajii TaxID=564305 RepID=A0ABZ1CUQ4_9TREE|nr:hypothetical protein IL334_002011 [Kwoniella shivajii]
MTSHQRSFKRQINNATVQTGMGNWERDTLNPTTLNGLTEEQKEELDRLSSPRVEKRDQSRSLKGSGQSSKVEETDKECKEIEISREVLRSRSDVIRDRRSTIDDELRELRSKILHFDGNVTRSTEPGPCLTPVVTTTNDEDPDAFEGNVTQPQGSPTLPTATSPSDAAPDLARGSRNTSAQSSRASELDQNGAERDSGGGVVTFGNTDYPSVVGSNRYGSQEATHQGTQRGDKSKWKGLVRRFKPWSHESSRS